MNDAELKAIRKRADYLNSRTTNASPSLQFWANSDIPALLADHDRLTATFTKALDNCDIPDSIGMCTGHSYTMDERCELLVDHVKFLTRTLDIMTDSLDAEATAHSLTRRWSIAWRKAAKKWWFYGGYLPGELVDENELLRAALVASPVYVVRYIPDVETYEYVCVHCGALALSPHAPYCTRQVALYGDDWRKETEE